MKNPKKPETVEVEMDFLMKMANQIDTLTTQVKDLQKPVQSDEKRFKWSVTFTVPNLDNQTEMQKGFLNDLNLILLKYAVSKLSVDYKK